MEWHKITKDTVLDYAGTYLFRYPKGTGLYLSGELIDQQDRRIMIKGSDHYPDALDNYTHYMLIDPPKGF